MVKQLLSLNEKEPALISEAYFALGIIAMNGEDVYKALGQSFLTIESEGRHDPLVMSLCYAIEMIAKQNGRISNSSLLYIYSELRSARMKKEYLHLALLKANEVFIQYFEFWTIDSDTFKKYSEDLRERYNF